jgi:proline dehydrogenase
VSQALNRAGAEVTVDLLGEFITDARAAEVNREAYLDLITRFEGAQVQGNYSLKPTMFGLLIDPDRCYEAIRDIVSLAAAHRNFIRIDMEDSRCVDLEIELFGKLKTEFPQNVGLVLQAYLRRTPDDLRNMQQQYGAKAPLNFRLCKGIYREPPEIAYQAMPAINRAYVENLEFMFQNGMYAGIATHDRELIEAAHQLIAAYDVPPDRYEFQMLYGVTPRLRQQIIAAGHKLRVYVPFGEHWFGYATRRLKENPALIRHFARALFIKG